MTTNRIVIAEDYAIGREAIRSIVSSYKDFVVVGEAVDGKGVIDSVAKHSPNLVIMSLPLPDMGNLELLRKIRSDYPLTKVLVLTDQDTQDLIFSTPPEYVNGCLLKDTSGTELVVAVNNIMAGKPYFSSKISEKIIQDYIRGIQTQDSALESLTNREREILILIASGQKNKEIAKECCISVKTVQKHRSNLMKKLDLHNSAVLTTFAIQNGLIIV